MTEITSPLPPADVRRIRQALERLASFNGSAGQGITRVLFSQEELDARAYVKSLMSETGLTVREDPIGNIFGLLPGEQPELAPVLSGSHIDTVLHAGMFDGTAGVVGAIESCRMIRESGAPHKRGIVAAVFTSEEPTRFGVGCIGSRAMTGHLKLEDTKHMRDDGGKTLYQVLESLGYPIDSFSSVQRRPGDFFAGVELHIEQAPVLEQTGTPVGVVEGICAPTYIHVRVTGRQGHAGSTPMQRRSDAVCAAAEIVLQLESLAKQFNTEYGDSSTVGTVGKLNVYPNAPNVIAGRTDFIMDIRDVDAGAKERMTARITGFLDDVAQRRGVSIHFEIAENDTPRRSDPQVVAVLENVCRSRKIPYRRMISGAYHDSMIIGEIMPIAMVFVPSRGGISHDPAEYTSFEQIATGTDVLAGALLELANRAG